MENILKKILLITASTVISIFPVTHAHAAFDYSTGYTITVGGYFAQPQLSSTNQWLGNFPVNSNLNSQINNGYQFGFLTTILYQFTDTPYNALLGYNHLDIKTNAQSSLNSTDQLNVETNLDEIDLNIGRNFDLVKNLSLRLAAGARYTHIKYKTDFTSTTAGIASYSGSTDGSYSGAGPMLFIDANYLIAYGLSIAAHAFAGGILGNINLSQADTVQPDDSSLNYVAKNQSQLIPNLGGSVGLGYSYISENYKFNAELGYMINYYGNALMVSNEPTHNFTGLYFHGPYLNLELGF